MGIVRFSQVLEPSGRRVHENFLLLERAVEKRCEPFSSSFWYHLSLVFPCSKIARHDEQVRIFVCYLFKAVRHAVLNHVFYGCIVKNRVSLPSAVSSLLLFAVFTTECLVFPFTKGTFTGDRGDHRRLA